MTNTYRMRVNMGLEKYVNFTGNSGARGRKHTIDDCISTVGVSIDLRKAFDRVDHNTLIKQVETKE